jgi:hypothetical protein
VSSSIWLSSCVTGREMKKPLTREGLPH